MKFIAFSDPHFYKNLSKSVIKKGQISSWFAMQKDIITNIFNFAHDHDIKVIICGGDLYEQKNYIPQDLYNAVWDLFKEYSNDFTIIFNSGNHDLLTLSRESGLKPFSDIVTVASEPNDFEFGDTFIRVLPYGMVEKNLGLPETKYDKYIVFTHEDISNLVYGCTDHKISTRLKPQIFGDWDYVFNGHIHKPQDINNIINIGSTHVTDWGEKGESKRFIYYNEGTIQSIKTVCPEFINAPGFSDRIRAKIEKDDYNYYRVDISSEELSDPLFSKFNVSPNVIKRRKRINRLIKNTTVEDEITEYITLQDTNLDVEKLAIIGKELLNG